MKTIRDAIYQGPPHPVKDIYVKNLYGDVTPLIGVSPSTSTDSVKEMLQAKWGIPVDQQRLIFRGMQLEDGKKPILWSRTRVG